MPYQLVYAIAFLGTATAASLILSEMMPDLQSMKVRTKMGGPLASKQMPGLFKVIRPGILLVAPIIGGTDIAWMPGIKKRTEKKLKAGGYYGVVPVEEFIAAKFVFAAMAIVVSIIYLPIVGIAPLYLGTLAGFFIPNLWIRDQIAARRKQITKDLPFFLDLMTLSVEAGLDFSAAIAKVIEKARPSALREEFQIMLHETQLGASRSEALHNLAERIQTSEIASLSATLIQAAQIGASIGDSLRAQSEIVRSSRFTTAEKKGAEASQKMLIPMVLFVMPSVLLVIVSPIIIRYVTGDMGD